MSASYYLRVIARVGELLPTGLLVSVITTRGLDRVGVLQSAGSSCVDVRYLRVLTARVDDFLQRAVGSISVILFLTIYFTFPSSLILHLHL